MSKDQRDTLLAALVASVLVIAYVVSPIDLIPDVFPFVGWLDDIVLVIVAAGIAMYAARELRTVDMVDEEPVSAPDVVEAVPDYDPIPPEKLKAL